MAQFYYYTRNILFIIIFWIAYANDTLKDICI